MNVNYATKLWGEKQVSETGDYETQMDRCRLRGTVTSPQSVTVIEQNIWKPCMSPSSPLRVRKKIPGLLPSLGFENKKKKEFCWLLFFFLDLFQCTYFDIPATRWMAHIVQGGNFGLSLFLKLQFVRLDLHITATCGKRCFFLTP